MVDLPEPDEPTIKVSSLEGRNRDALVRMGRVGLEGYENEISCSASSPAHLVGVILRMVTGFCDSEIRVNKLTMALFPFARPIN